MKALKQQIDEIKNNSNLTHSQKCEALIKIGLRPRDLEILGMGAQPRRRATGFATIKCGDLTFGVEIECVGARRADILREFAAQCINIAFEGYNHRDHHDLQYKLVTDSSVQGLHAIECVTPVLKGNADKGMASLKKACKALNAAGAKANRSCGLHVHVGCEKMTPSWYLNVFKTYKACEKVIDTFMAPSRRASNSQWCKSLEGFDFSTCHTYRDVDYTMRCDRYHKVNPCSWDRHRTIEFRQHGGTTNAKKISMWVDFLRHLVMWSRDHVMTKEAREIGDLPFLTKALKDYYTKRAAEFAAALA